MTCQHTSSAVYDTRPPDATNRKGYRYYRELPCKAYAMRRRRCLDCGHKFLTAEVPIEVLNDLNTQKVELAASRIGETLEYLLEVIKDGEANQLTSKDNKLLMGEFNE